MYEVKIDLSRYENHLGRKHQIIRMLWSVTWAVCAGWLPRSVGSWWKRVLLKAFGARMGHNSIVYSSARVYYPANLVMGDNTCLASDVDCYNVARVVLEDNVTVSQGAYLCTASHDISNPAHPLVTAPIVLKSQSWVAAHAFVGMGVTIGEGAVVGATASVYKNVEPWTVVGGNPAKVIKMRKLVNINSGGVNDHPTSNREQISVHAKCLYEPFFCVEERRIA